MSNFRDKNVGLITFLDFQKIHIKILYWVMFAFLVVLSIICILPPAWVFLSSLKEINEFLSIPPTLIPKTFHPEKIVQAWNSMNFGHYYANTLMMALGELAFCIVCNGLAGYVLSKLKPKGSVLVFTMILWIMMLPNSVSMVPLFMTFLDFPIIHVNLTNTYIPMWLMAGANPFYILLFKSFFDSIPFSYVEAARIDGCSNMGIFRKIILPLSKPVLMVVTIFSINGSWESFFWPYLVLKNSDMYTVAVQIFKMKEGGFPIDLYMIALMFAVAPPAIFFILFQKHIMSGFTMSGVKG